MDKYKVLYDLCTANAAWGTAGIPQESRLLFTVLSQIPTVTLNGLLISNQSRKIFLEHKNNIPKELHYANILANLLPDNEKLSAKKKASYAYKMHMALRLSKKLYWLMNKKNFSTLHMDSKNFYEFIWRNYFMNTLLAEYYPLIQQQDFYLSDLCLENIFFGVRFNRIVSLDTKKWDFVVFQDQRAVKVSPNTIKIVRYHDAVPIFMPDVVSDQITTAIHSKTMRVCQKDAFYVCNSEPVREHVVTIYPHLEQRSTVITPIINPAYTYKYNIKYLTKILLSRISKFSAKLYKDHSMLANFVGPYFLALSTLEPRKNYLNLIAALSQLHSQHDVNIKLIIIGKNGWRMQPILDAMKSHIISGDIIHLEDVDTDEISYIYSHALALVAPAFYEGFGSPPLEAMQCRCPVIAADHKTHRWVLGDAAMYCDPYSIESIAQVMWQLIGVPGCDNVRHELIEKGLQRVALYSRDKSLAKWEELFVKLKNDTKLQSKLQQDS